MLWDTAPVGMCVLDADLRHVRLNQRFTELTGLPPEFYLGRTVREIAPKAWRKCRALFRQIAATGQPIRDIEFLRDTSSGRERAWVAHWFPIKDARGRVVGVNVAFEDCTERKRAEAERDDLFEALDGERRKLAAVLEQLPVGVVIADAPSGRIVLANEASARMMRIPVPASGSVVDYRQWKVFTLHGRRLQPRQYPLLRAIRAGVTVSGEEIMVERGDGTRGAIMVNAAPIRDARGRIVAGAVAFSDITAQREMLDALRESEVRFRRIAENSPFGLGMNDAEGRIVYMNPKLTEITGYRPRDLPRIEDWFCRAYPEPGYRRQVQAMWAADVEDVRRGKIPHSPVREYRLACGDGSVKICEITFALGKDVTYAMFNDVTARKRVEGEILLLNAKLEDRVAERTKQLAAANEGLRKEIAERQRLQSQVIAVSEREQRRLGEGLHDMLGQELTGLGLRLSLLERELRAEGHDGAEVVEQVGTMLREAVQTARDLSRQFYPVALDQGGLILALRHFAASTEAVSGVRCQVRHRPSFHFPPDAAIHLFRIAQEAVTNALKHAAPRRICIELTTRRRRPVLRILNDGRGYRAPRKVGGGLGMHIVRHRADLIGAEVTVTRGERGGCVLECTLARGGQ